MRAGVRYRVAGTEPQGSIATFDELYERMWWPMVRIAFALVDDVSAAEDVVQDAFAALHRRWDGLNSPAAAAGYLRVSVVNGARSVLRKRMVARRGIHLFDDPPAEARRRLGASLDFVSPLDGWAITPHRAFATSDGGRTWRAKLGRSHSQLTTAAFWDADQGWVFGSVNGRPAALRTADGGQTWIRSDLPSGYVLDAASRGCVAVAVTSTKAFRSSRCG